MTGMPAARLYDTTAHGDPLKPGTCSPNVWIGNKPAWRGLPATAVQQLFNKFKQVVQKAGEVLATPEPAKAERLKEMNEGVAEMLQIMASADQHICSVIKVVIPDGNGVVINGSPTVLINGLPACRVGDTIMETTSVNTIASGEKTVLIGGVGAAIDASTMSAMNELKAQQAKAEEEEKKKAEAQKSQ